MAPESHAEILQAALAAIHRAMDGTQWGPDTLDEIAGILETLGYRCREPENT